MGAAEAGRAENSGEPCLQEGSWRGDSWQLGGDGTESELLQFSRGEVGIDHENFSRKLREKKGKDPKIEYVNMQRWVSFLSRSLLLI